jgi:hypothetical protein
VEVPDQPSARALRSELEVLDVDTVAENGHWEVCIELGGRDQERRVVCILNSIDRWLPTTDLDSVRVHLGGSSYTLHAPVAATSPSAV